ncbi:MAG: hypothetical protein ACTHJM_02345 [Marmoricola sp.]
MTSMSMRGSGDEIAELRAEIEKLKATTIRRRGWRRPLALLGSALLVVGMVAGVAGASGYGTADVTMVPLSPAYKLTSLTGSSIAAGKTLSLTVAGAPTPVPDDATTVQLTVSVVNSNGGQLNIYPAGNPSAPNGYVPWSGGVKATDSVNVNVGTKNQITIANNSFGTATVTVTETGYSVQVNAADISGAQGTAGQVLTNTGTGASWQDAGGPGFQTSFFGPNGPITANDFNPALLGTYTPPPGKYLVTFSGEVEDTSTTTSDFVQCSLDTQYDSIGSAIASVTPGAKWATIAISGMVDDSYAPGTIKFYCSTGSAVGTFTYGHMDLVQVSQANGDASFGAKRH